MKSILLRAAVRMVSFLLRGINVVVARSRDDSSLRKQLSQFHEHLRESAHKHRADIIRHRYDIDPTVRWGRDTLVTGKGTIRIGGDTYLGSNCFVVAEPREAKIVMGTGCAISHNVHLRTAEYRTDVGLDEARSGDLSWGDIIVGDNVWIGANVFVKGGVTIGEGSIVGANSVVTEDIPAGGIWGGVPARLLRHRDCGKGESERRISQA